MSIFCYYDKNGVVSKDISYICNKIRNVSDYFIVVINGKVQSKSEFEEYSDVVVVRDNLGMDAGAYKKALFSEEYYDIIHKCDELVLCNSSFFGPFVSLKDIFLKMGSSDADYWGISSSEHDWVSHIQSYFIVFRRAILTDVRFWDYWKDHIDDGTSDYDYVCASFENGLCNALTRYGYHYDAYVPKIKCNEYKNPYGSLSLDGLPILKKKVFSDSSVSKKQIACSVEYICSRYGYPKEWMTDYAKRVYGVDVDFGCYAFGECCDIFKDITENNDLESRGTIETFINSHDGVYIFGTGYLGRSLFSLFFFYRDNPKLKGFLVSENVYIKQEYLWGYPVETYDMRFDDEAIIVALNKNNSRDVKRLISNVNEKCYVLRDI